MHICESSFHCLFIKKEKSAETNKFNDFLTQYLIETL